MVSINQQIQSQIHRISQSNRFNVSNTQRHIHNDIDSPFVFQPILTYIGTIEYNGSVGLLPVGWTVDTVDEGGGRFLYVINHNLNTRLYSFVTTAQQSLNSIVTPIAESLANSVEVAWFTTGSTPGLANTSFSFVLTTIANKNTKLPRYYGVILD